VRRRAFDRRVCVAAGKHANYLDLASCERSCGDDGLGESYGACPDGERCGDDGLCRVDEESDEAPVAESDVIGAKAEGGVRLGCGVSGVEGRRERAVSPAWCLGLTGLALARRRRANASGS